MIDWIDVHFGHPAVDLALAYVTLPVAARSAFFAAYGQLTPALDAWSKWRAITWASGAIEGASARGDGTMARECIVALREMSRP